MDMYKKITLLYLFLSVILLIPNYSVSQNKKLSFEEFVIKDGLASVNCILKDKEGFMWFGGTHGLYRYDGYKFKSFISNNENKFSLSNNNIISLYEDSQGFIWVGTMQGGINKYNPYTELFTNHKNSKNLIFTKNHITTITEDDDGVLWVGTFGDGIYTFDKKNKNSTKFLADKFTENSISNNDVFSILADKNIIWITSNSGKLDYYDKKLKKIFHYKYSNKNFKSTRSGQRMCLDHKGNIWIGTEEKGLYKFEINSKTFEHFQHINGKNSISSNTITDIKEGENGGVWMTTGNGLNLFNTNTNQISIYKNDVYNKHSIVNNISYCLFIDVDYSIWLGMGDGTVNRTINSPFEIYQTSFSKESSSLSFNVVVSLFMTDDRLWIGTGGGGLDRLDLKTKKFYNYKNNPNDKSSIPSNIVMTVIEDNEHNVWTGNFRNSLIGYKKKNSTKFFELNPILHSVTDITHNMVFDLTEDDNNNIWVATYNEGLFKYNKITKKFIQYKYSLSKNSLLSDKILRLLYDGSGRLWIGTLDKGVQIYDSTKNNFLSLSELGISKTLQISNPIKDIFEDSLGIIWIATEGEGIYQIDLKKNSFKRITIKNGLPSNSIYGIIEDNNNNFWFATNRGIANYTNTTKNIINYNTNNGLPTNDFESGSIAKSKDGKLFFGSKKGLIAFYPNQLKTKSIPINIKLTNFKIFNKNVNVNERIESFIPLDSSIVFTKRIKLPYFLDNFTFEFAAPGYPSPYNIKYEYKLKGLDNRWITTSSERHFANFSNVPPGSYTFRVKAIEENSNEQTNFSEKYIHILISPVWWQTNVAKIIYFLLFSSFIYFIYSSVRNKVKLKNELLLEKYKYDKDEELHQSKINFFTTISHELRTSLTLILVPLSELVKRNDLNNKASNLIMIMNRNGQRLLSLVNQILDFRKMESNVSQLKVAHIDIKSFFTELCIPFYQYAKEKNILFNLTVSNSCKKGWIDSNKLEIILYNIISNAFKFTDNKIDVNIDLDEKDEKLLIKIKDNGNGIDEEDIDKIFDDFYQTKSNLKNKITGTGIGLAITKNLVHLHYGTLYVKSNLKEYTIFNVLIPITKAFYDNKDIVESIDYSKIIQEKSVFNLSPEYLSEESQQIIFKQKPILLIVEDNFEIRNLIKNHFSTCYKIHTASNGIDACEKAFSTIPNIIISDIMMPKMNGLELCKKLKTDNRTSHIPIVLLTARGSHTFKMEGLKHGADDYVTKPFSIDILDIRVQNLIKSRHLLREKFKKEIILKPKDIAINNVDEVFLEKIMQIIEDNMSDSKFSVTTLATEIGMSHSVLYRKIMALTNQNVNEFIKSMKLMRAAQLIKNSNNSISEISDMTGFSNPKYFSTCFKKKYGETPSKYNKESINI